MMRILVINPNRSEACGAGIAAAISPFARPGGTLLDVVSLPDGPPAIYSWADWHAAVGPILRRIAADPADAYIIACASDPGIEAARAATAAPVFGIFRAAVAAAVARAERFGILAIVEASKARHRAALRAMGLETRLAATEALNVSMDRLLDPTAARAALVAAARACAAGGAETIILGCTGMAHHRRAVEDAAGVPVIEPCQQAAALALAALEGGPVSRQGGGAA
ncbi:MAG: AroM family protein [Rhodospirillales bacterium]|jgi:Asp/Glu/hydantoin racemase|nr:AroM family protein [Rhodospirillales bacterium]